MSQSDPMLLRALSLLHARFLNLWFSSSSPRTLVAIASLLGPLAFYAAETSGHAQQTVPVNPARITQAVDDSVLTTLRGNIHPLATPQFNMGPVDPSLLADRMQLALQRSPSQEVALRQFLGSLQDTNSPQYRKWLTPEQFGAEYGVAEADIQTVSKWLASQGFTVNKVNKARTIIEFSGSVSQIQTAFHTQLHNFVMNGELHLANVSDPQIPAALAPVVAGLSSLNDFFPKAQHTNTKLQLGRYDKATGKLVAELTGGSASPGNSLYLVPGDAATIYDTPNSFNTKFSGGTSYTGSGVTIGIVGNSNITVSDVLNYRSIFGLSATAPTVVVDGNDPGVNGDVVEALLDLEVSGGLAPAATQIFYTAADTIVDSGLFLAIARALDDNAASILNVTFVYCEPENFNGFGIELYNLWEQAAAQGITVVVSTGDSGSAGCDDPYSEPDAQAGLYVNGLASTPFNIAVGGTDFDILANSFATYVSPTNGKNFTSALSYIPEEPWNDSTAANGLLSENTPAKDPNGETNIFAAGGGASSCALGLERISTIPPFCPPTAGSFTGWPKPPWQTGSNLNIPADGVRDLPDISLFSANGKNGAAWAICYTFVDSSGNTVSCAPNASGEAEFIAVGGTSTSAAAFSGVLALISQSQGTRLGQANYVLYNLANQASLYSSAFHDIQTGNNSVYCPNCGGNMFEAGYNAGVGYDQASGLGSVDVTQLINIWTKAIFTPSTTKFTVNGGTAPVSITHGQSVTLSASVAGAGATPSGVVTLASNVDQQASTYNSNSIAAFTLTSGSTGPQTYSNLPGGAYTISAYYGGDINFAQSQSSPSILVTVAKENSVLNFFADYLGNNVGAISGSYPYATPLITLIGYPLGISQQNAPAGATLALATGTVTFSDTAGPLPGSSPGSAAGAVAINAAGYAMLPFSSWSTGSHSISASYNGDNNFNPSTAGPINFTITPGPTYINVSSSASSVSSGSFNVSAVIIPVNGSNFGGGLSFPTGTVTLTANGATIGTGTVTPSVFGASVVIAVEASLLTSGTNTITATYSGDTNYLGCSGTVVVAQSSTTTQSPAVAISATSIAAITAGTSGTITVTLTPSNGFTGYVGPTWLLTGTPSGAISVPYIYLNNPSDLYISGTTAATTTLTVQTTSTTTAGKYTLQLNAVWGSPLTILSNVVNLTFTVNALAPVLVPGTFSVSATALTVSPGATSGNTSTVSVSPMYGFTGAVNLTAALTTSPANAAYSPTISLAASSITISGTTATTTVATISTTAATSGALVYPQTLPWYTAAGGAAMACLLFFGMPSRRCGWRSMLSLLVFLVAIAGAGCGGGSSNSGTTPGNYVFTITGTDAATGKIKQTGTIAFTVN